MAEHFTKFEVKTKNGKILMIKCKKCNVVVGNNGYLKWRHWKKLCPGKWLFKCNPVVDGKYSTTCLVCHKRFTNIMTIPRMIWHREHCKPKTTLAEQNVQQPNGNSTKISEQHEQYPHAEFQLQTLDQSSSNLLENISMNRAVESSVARSLPTKNAKKLLQGTVLDLKRLQYNMIAEAKQGRKYIHCQICKHWLDVQNMQSHRIKCKITENADDLENIAPQPSEADVLICVQTIHLEDTNEEIEQLNDPQSFVGDESQHISLDFEICFICDSTIDEPFVKIGETISAHSDTKMSKFVWKFLGKKPSIRSDSLDATGLQLQLICKKCLDLVNEYDAVRSNTKRIKKQLCESLAKSEAKYEKIQTESIAYMNDDSDENQTNGSAAQLIQTNQSQIVDFIDLYDDDSS